MAEIWWEAGKSQSNTLVAKPYWVKNWHPEKEEWNLSWERKGIQNKEDFDKKTMEEAVKRKKYKEKSDSKGWKRNLGGGNYLK